MMKPILKVSIRSLDNSLLHKMLYNELVMAHAIALEDNRIEVLYNSLVDRAIILRGRISRTDKTMVLDFA